MGLWSSVTSAITSARILAPNTKRELTGSAADMNRAAAIVSSLALPTLRKDANMGFNLEIVGVAPFLDVLLPRGASTLMSSVWVWLFVR